MSGSTGVTAPVFADALHDRLDGSPLLLMLDVDGTLAPIAPTPTGAAIPEPTREVLRRLAALPGVALAFVSGRSVGDAWRMTGLPGTWIIGNHGFELRVPGGDIAVDERVREFEPAIASAAATLEADLRGVRGSIVENKRWTLSVHYRQVEPADVPRLTARADAVARELGLRITDGKRIVELRPPVEINKGTASVALLRRAGVSPQAGGALYAGDDRTDEDAFRALRAALPGVVTVRITCSEDQRAESNAEFALPSTQDLRGMLEWLAARRGAPATGSVR